MADAAQAQIDLIARANQFNGTMDRVERTLKRVEMKMRAVSQAAQLMLVGQVAAYATVVKQAANAEESLSKFATVFGEQADAAEDWAKRQAKAMQRSRLDIQEYLSTFQGLFKGFGFAGDEAAELSKELAALGIDLASFNNTQDPEAINALRSAIVGEAEAVKRYGVILNQTALDQKLFEQGVKGGANAATEQQKIMARLAVIMEQTSLAQGDAARTSGSLTNVLKGLNAQSKDLTTALGQALAPVVLDLAIGLSELLEPVAQFIKNNQELVKTTLVAVTAMTAVVASTSLLVKTFAVAATATKVFTGTMALLHSLFAAIKGGNFVAIFAASLAKLGVITTATETAMRSFIATNTALIASVGAATIALVGVGTALAVWNSEKRRSAKLQDMETRSAEKLAAARRKLRDANTAADQAKLNKEILEGLKMEREILDTNANSAGGFGKEGLKEITRDQIKVLDNQIAKQERYVKALEDEVQKQEQVRRARAKTAEVGVREDVFTERLNALKLEEEQLGLNATAQLEAELRAGGYSQAQMEAILAVKARIEAEKELQAELQKKIEEEDAFIAQVDQSTQSMQQQIDVLEAQARAERGGASVAVQAAEAALAQARAQKALVRARAEAGQITADGAKIAIEALEAEEKAARRLLQLLREREAMDAAKEQRAKEQVEAKALEAEGEALRKSLRTKEEIRAEEEERLKKLREAGAITQETLERALKNLEEQSKQTSKRQVGIENIDSAFRRIQNAASTREKNDQRKIADATKATQKNTEAQVKQGTEAAKKMERQNNLLDQIANRPNVAIAG